MNRYLFIAFLLFITYTAATAQVRFYEQGSYRIHLNYNSNTSSSYFDLNGDQILFQRDTFNITLQDSTPYQYVLKHTYDLREYIITTGFDYSFDNNLITYINIPLMWTTLTNAYEIDTNRFSPTYGNKTIRGDYSAFTPLHYEIGGIYRLNKGPFVTSLKLGAMLPPTLKNGYQIDTMNSMYIYNAYKFYGGILSTFTMEKGFLELETTYNFRSGDFNDLFLIRVEGGFTSVPNTALKGIFIYNLNMSGFDNAQPVNPRYTTLQESSIDVGAAFEVFIGNRAIIDFAYLIRLGLVNTIHRGQLVLRTSLQLN